MRLRTWGRSVCVVVGLLLAGCGGAPDGRLTVYPTTGTVTVDGKPAAGARVTLYAATDELQQAKAPIPTGEVAEDGTFSLTSYELGDGAPAGEWNATIVWPEAIPEGVDEEMYQPKDRLQGKYQDPAAAGLKATVDERATELPAFAL